MSKAWELSEIATADFRTSESAAKETKRLGEFIGTMPRYGPVRLALALSLREEKPAKPVTPDHKTGAIKGQNLFGDATNRAAWVALITQRADQELSKQDFIAEVAKHWDRGIKILSAMRAAAVASKADSYNEFIKALSDKIGTTMGDNASSGDFDISGDKPYGDISVNDAASSVSLHLGLSEDDESYGQEINWQLNARGYAPHIAIMGASGGGKTRLGLRLAESIAQQSKCATFIFDMKGDIANNKNLCKALGAKVIKCPGEPVPLDILHVEDRKDQTQVQNTAAAFGDSLGCVIQNNFGTIQKNRVREVVARLISQGGKISLDDVQKAYRGREDTRGEDTVSASLESICAYNLFQPKQSPADFFRHSWVFMMKDATENIQRFAALMLLDALRRYFIGLDDAPVDAKENRKIRALLVVDEAHRILGFKHLAVIGILRESRSKGGATMLISQSPRDYVNEDANLLENIGAAVCFRAMAEPSDVRKVFHEKIRVDKLETGICLARLAGHDKPIEKIKAWAK